ncbi:M23 family metallopeptidase [Acaryochloris sp. IP29b_bin.148]|uniref:M23 family metallopeptidase n=1 Tax=Acaryochloris sp. IP29b_bin.148 TaxID=2969218 RepID=UPI0034530A81
MPKSTTTLLDILLNQIGRKQWFDNRGGSHPLSNFPSSALQGFCHPLKGKGFLSQGPRGITHRGRMEYAYDFGVPIGMPVYAMQSGKVIGLRDAYPDKGGKKQNADKFNFIWLEHDNGVRSAYIHLQQNFRRRIPLRVNDRVKAGQLIGYSGNSGWSTAPHLHVEVHSSSGSAFGQTLPFVIAAKCDSKSIAKAD